MSDVKKIKLSTRSRERLIEADPLYQWVDYWNEDGFLVTISVKEFYESFEDIGNG